MNHKSKKNKEKSALMFTDEAKLHQEMTESPRPLRAPNIHFFAKTSTLQSLFPASRRGRSHRENHQQDRHKSFHNNQLQTLIDGELWSVSEIHCRQFLPVCRLHAFRTRSPLTSENSQSGGRACQTRDSPTREFGVAVANPDNPHFPDVSQFFPERCAKSSMGIQISNPAFDIGKMCVPDVSSGHTLTRGNSSSSLSFDPGRYFCMRCETMNASPSQYSLNT